jgi:hypothetical protein
MLRQAGLILALVVAVATPAAAQESGQAAYRHALAERLIQVSQGANIRKEVEARLAEMMKAMPTQKDGEEGVWLRANIPTMTLSMVDQMMTSMVDVYAEVYDAEELQAQIEFFETPIGRRVAANAFDLGEGVGRVTMEAQ